MATAFPDVKPFPGAAAQSAAPMGHNRPPIEEQGVADFNDAIDRHAGLRQRIADLLGSASRAVATDDETAGRCAELIRQMSAAEKVVDGEREAVKRPYLTAGRHIDDAAKTLVSDLGTAKGKVRGIAETYMRQKAAEEAAARRRVEYAQAIMDHIRACGMGMIDGKTYPFPILIHELEEKVVIDDSFGELEGPARQLLASTLEKLRAAFKRHMERPEEVFTPEPEPEPVAYVAPPKDTPVQVRSDLGAVASARKVKVAVITDWGKAFKAVKGVAGVQEAIQKAVNGLVRAGQADIAGVEIKEEIGLSVR